MSGNYFRENEWWVSPYNFAPEVRAQFNLPARVSIHDATLRDGEQTPGVVYSVADKIAIAEKLAEIGVDRIEAGMPAVSDQDFEAIKQISRRSLKSKIYTFARAINADIDKAVECGCHGVIIEVPIGYPKLKYQFKWTWEDVLKKSVGVIAHAKARGLHVVYFPYDTTRAREEDLTNLLRAIMQEAPPDAVGVVDTMGCALPQAIKHMVRLVKSLTNLPVEVHTHNDFGMAVATELAGVEAGAECVHSCANGLGERTGNAALEELIVALHVLYGYETQYDLSKLPELGALVSRLSRFPTAANKPILGERNFTRESGIGVDLVVKEPLAMFGTHPALTGRRGEVVLGKKSGKASITYNLEQMGITGADDDAIGEMLRRVKEKGIAKRGLLTDAEFKQIVESVLAASRTGPLMSRYVRYRAGLGAAWGIVDGDTVREIQGGLLDGGAETGRTHKLAGLTLLSPCEPGKIVAVGRNYRSHLGSRAHPQNPEIFYKPISSLQDPEGPIVIPPDATDVHYEGELVLVIGKRVKDVSGPAALAAIFGATCGNDVSERNWQHGERKDIQWWRAKGSDTFSPVGPAVVTGLNYDDLLVQTRLNGEVVQKERTADFIFDCATMVGWISRWVTLLPGDLIFTGTPGTTRPMSPGDVVEVEIEGIGILRNPVG